MTKEQRCAYCQTRMQHADECLQAAQLLLDHGDYKAATNRSYYAVFHAMRAANVMAEIPEQTKHTGVASKFREYYIKNSLLDKSLSDIITDLFEVRNESDYDDFYIISKEDTIQQIEDARRFVAAIRYYLENQLDTN